MVRLLRLEIVDDGEDPGRKRLEAPDGLRMHPQIGNRLDRTTEPSTTSEHKHCRHVNGGISATRRGRPTPVALYPCEAEPSRLHASNRDEERGDGGTLVESIRVFEVRGHRRLGVLEGARGVAHLRLVGLERVLRKRERGGCPLQEREAGVCHARAVCIDGEQEP
jgi:hypothetical protein